jgi:hypothetical protein
VTTASWARAQRARGRRVGGLEPGPIVLRRARSWRWLQHDLRFLHARRDRSCPPRTSGSRSRADLARTRRPRSRLAPVPSGRGQLWRSGPPRPGTDRPARHGKDDPQRVRGLRVRARWRPKRGNVAEWVGGLATAAGLFFAAMQMRSASKEPAAEEARKATAEGERREAMARAVGVRSLSSRKGWTVVCRLLSPEWWWGVPH